jgi:hypothetical protein
VTKWNAVRKEAPTIVVVAGAAGDPPHSHAITRIS